MARIDHRLLANIPNAHIGGYLGAQRATLNDLQMDAHARQQRQEANLGSLFASRGEGETYGEMAARGADMGLSPNMILRLEGMGQTERQIAANDQQRRIANQQRGREFALKEVNSWASRQKAITQQYINAKDQKGLDAAIAMAKTEAAKSKNPGIRRMGEMMQGITIGQNGEVNKSTMRMTGKEARESLGVTGYDDNDYVEVTVQTNTKNVLGSKEIDTPKKQKVKSSVHTRQNPETGETEVVRVYEDGREPVVTNLGVDLRTADATRKAINQGLALINKIQSGSELDQYIKTKLAEIGVEGATVEAGDKKTIIREIKENVDAFKKRLKVMEKGGGGDDLPPGVSEADIQHTMKAHGLTREQVLERLGNR